jgi:hypothetical protein
MYIYLVGNNQENEMLCKQMNEVKAMMAVDESQHLKHLTEGVDYIPLISNVKVDSIRKEMGIYKISFNMAGYECSLGRQRGGVREFASIESAIRTCKLLGFRDIAVRVSNVDWLRSKFAKDEPED